MTDFKKIRSVYATDETWKKFLKKAKENNNTGNQKSYLSNFLEKIANQTIIFIDSKQEVNLTLKTK